MDASLIGSQNALNFAYILYLTLRSQKHTSLKTSRVGRAQMARDASMLDRPLFSLTREHF